MRIIFYTKYPREGASSRLRSYQYKSFFESLGYECIYYPLHSSTYIHLLYTNQPRYLDAFKSYFKRLISLFKIRKQDIIIIEKEIFPYMPPVIEFFLKKIGIRYIVDFDDAIHHNYDNSNNFLVRFLLKNKIPIVMKSSEIVTVGNEYLANYAKKNNSKKIIKIPTVIDNNKYFVESKLNKTVNIGWIGTPYTSVYLKNLIPVFERLYEKFPIKIILIGALKNDFDFEFIDCIQWSEESEVRSIQMLDIGIMPLEDSPFERGKCGYKLIQYMACGIPVIASPVGENKVIVDDGNNGYLAKSNKDWEDFLNKLIKDEDLRRRIGMNGYNKVQKNYTIDSQKYKYEKLLRSLNE